MLCHYCFIVDCHQRRWRRRWLFAYLICREQAPPSSRKPESMFWVGRVSQVTVEVKPVGPDLFQQEGTWLVKDRNDSG